ncbi:MAG TPA: WHG domain-containing protein [Solirubrobacteraceae bacterium]|jgi:AcrR family transcriptional regulator|nr:WHG domain-containing protein [Solirubrobacteraceae bacterium]
MPRRGLDRSQVIEAAIAIADRDGLGAVTLARVAGSLGVRPPSLYHHVDGHEGLMRAIALRGLAELTATLQAAALGRAGPDALRATAHAYRDYAHAHPGAYAATLRAGAPGDAEHEEAGRKAVEVMIAVLRAWRLEDEEMIHAVRVIRSALHGFVALEAAGGFALPLDIDTSFERLIATVAAALPPAAAPEEVAG